MELTRRSFIASATATAAGLAAASLAYAGEALTGRFIGEKNLSLTKESIRYVFYWSMSIVIGFMAAYWFGGMPLLRLMS